MGYNDDDLEELVLKNVDRPMLMKAELDESIKVEFAIKKEAGGEVHAEVKGISNISVVMYHEIR